jgi:hypothetical protein
MKNGVFCGVTPCGSCKNGRFEELSASFIRVTIGELGTTLAVTKQPSNHFVFLRSVRRLLVTASVVPSSPILVTLMKETQSYSETSLQTRATWRKIPKDTILHLDSCFSHYYVLKMEAIISAETLADSLNPKAPVRNKLLWAYQNDCVMSHQN